MSLLRIASVMAEISWLKETPRRHDADGAAV
jgi:hypothetical protein